MSGQKKVTLKTDRKNGNGKKKNVWKIRGLISRVGALIIGGELKELGYDGIYGIIRGEFAKELKDSAYNLSKRTFRRKVNELIWTETILRQMRNAIRDDLSAEEFYKRLPFIPKGQFMYKWNELKGRTPKKQRAQFVRGVGRISKEISDYSEKRYQFPSSSFENPFIVPTTEEAPSVAFLNGINLGIPYSKVIDENPARQGMVYAETHNAAAIVLTNFLDIPFIKAAGAGLSVHRARISGRNINPGVFDKDYAAEVRHVFENSPPNELIYQTIAETFLDSMEGWRKITLCKGKPVYSGRVLIVLGYKEEAMIDTAAYWEAHYFWQKKLNELNSIKRLLEYRLKKVRGKKLQNRNLEVQLQEQLDVINDRISRTRVSNISDWDWNRFFNKVERFVIEKLQAVIPNAIVIGMGTSFISVGKRSIEIHIPDNVRSGVSTDRILADYNNNVYGPRVLDETIADAVVICHPHSPFYKWAKRERFHGKEDRLGVKERADSDVYVAPIAIDARRFGEVATHYVRKLPGVAKTAFLSNFVPGMMALRLINGIFEPSYWSMPALNKLSRKARKRNNANVHTRYIWVMMGTDTHMGNIGREYVLSNGRAVGSVEMAIELMRKTGLIENSAFPIHMFMLNDDPTQGHNFETQQRTHPNKMPYPEFEKWLKTKEEAIKSETNKQKRERLLDEMSAFMRRQILVRGEHWTSDQAEWFIDGVIEPNVDFFDALLRRVLRSKIEITGLSKVMGEEFDERDPGFIHFGTGGHHFHKTTNFEMMEGWIYARVLRGYLEAIPKWRGKRDILKRLIVAPRMSNQSIAYGMLGLPGEYQYALDIRDAPIKLDDWGDPLRGWVNINLRRGDPAGHMSGKFVLHFCGDKHFGCCTVTKNCLYVMGMPNTPTDQYAEGNKGFPPNNTGVVFVGIPAYGPKSGPFLIRHLSFATMRTLFKRDASFDWKTFLPNPI